MAVAVENSIGRIGIPIPHVRDVLPERPSAFVEYDPGEKYPEVYLGRGISGQLMWINDSVAREMIATQVSGKQRTMKQSVRLALNQDLNASAWMFNGEPIIFDWNGELADGQHRLTAVIDTSIPIFTLVIRGVDPAAFVSYDSGAKRTVADAFKSLGHKNAAVIGSAATYIWKFETGSIERIATPSKLTLNKVLQRHPGLYDSLPIVSPTKGICFAFSAAVALHYIFSRIDNEAADDFFGRLGSGLEMTEGDPIHSLRSWMVGIKGRPEYRDILARIIKAWNAKIMGLSIGKSRFGSKEGFPSIKDSTGKPFKFTS